MIVRLVIQYVYSEFNSDFAEGITKTQIRRLFDAGQPLSIYILNRGTTDAVYLNLQCYTHCYFSVSCRFFKNRRLIKPVLSLLNGVTYVHL